MKSKLTMAFLIGWLVLLMPLLATAQTTDKGSALKFEVQLVWATTNSVSPDAKHKDIAPEIRKQLEKLPLKWANYFEVNRKHLDVARLGSNKTSISEKCAISVKDVDGKKVEVVWFGKSGNLVGKQTQPLPKGQSLILGGNAPGATAWFVILKRIE